MGQKIVRPYPIGVMSDLMPWEMDISDRWLYIASDDGLVEYDGLFPAVFPLNNQRSVRSVSVDNDHKRIFVGGINEFGYFLPSSVNSLDYVCLSDSVGADRNLGNFWGIYHHEGSVIAQADHAVLIYDLHSGNHNVIGSESKLDVSAFINDALWLGTNDGLKVLLGNNIVDVPGAGELKHKRIRKILPYGNGLLIVATDGVWKYDSQRLTPVTEADKAIKQIGVVFSADVKGNLLALGSIEKGLAVVDLSTGGFEIYDEENGLASNTIISLKYDSNGNLWTGMQYGIGKVLLDHPVGVIDNSDVPIGSGYVMALKGRNLYLGTNRGLFLTEFDPATKKFGSQMEMIPGLRGQVWGLSLIDGVLFCSLDQGLCVIEDGGLPMRIGEFTGVWDVKKMLGNSPRAYMGTYNGLHLLKKENGKWTYESPVEGYSSSMYNFVQESPTIVWSNNSDQGIDRILVDTLNNRVDKIEHFIETQDGFPLKDTYISRIDNTIYFSTENGIYFYDTKNNVIAKERDLSRLLGNPKDVKRLKKINGGLFALTSHSLIEADPAGILDIKRLELKPSVARPMHEGDVLFPLGFDFIGFPTRTGYLVFDYSENANSLWHREPPRVNIKDLKVISNGDSTIYTANFENLRSEPLLNYKDNSVRVAFGNIEDVENGLLYSSRLNNEPWTQPSALLSREYTDLKPGKYKIEVKAIDPEGREASDSIVFRISPPWWSSNWMLCIYAVILIFVIFMLVRFEQLRVIKNRQRVIKQKNEEIKQQQLMHLKVTEEKDRQIETLEREKLDKELKHKAQEVANVMMSLSHKNETLQMVKRELQNITGMLPRTHTEARKAISELQDKVVVDIKSDDVLKRVEEEFDIIHDNFMKKLRTRYPDLNNNEILLCAYLKMNLTTKEIAPLLNISSRGVETMRYRLRKKLGLERDDSLTSFITTFS